MRVHVFGKVRRVGTSSKTGKPFDFIEIHYAGPARFVEGQAAKTKTFDPTLIPYESIIIPGDYEVDFDGDGAVVAIAPAAAMKS